MKKISKYVMPSIVVLILILDFLALDDITTGNQPNYWGEWDFLIASIFAFGLISYSKLGKSAK